MLIMRTIEFGGYVQGTSETSICEFKTPRIPWSGRVQGLGFSCGEKPHVAVNGE